MNQIVGISTISFLVLLNSCKVSKIYNNKTEYNYNDGVKEIFVQSYANDGTIEVPELGKKLSSSKTVFVDNIGKIDSIKIYNNGEIGLKIEIQDDSKSLCIEKMYSGIDGSLQRTTSHKHIRENEFEFVVLDAGGRIAQKGIKIVVQDKTIKESSTYYESAEYNTDYKYDKNNRLINQKRFREKDELIYDISYTYLEFDELNNWTKRIICHRNENGEITFNNIEISEYKYYKEN